MAELRVRRDRRTLSPGFLVAAGRDAGCPNGQHTVGAASLRRAFLQSRFRDRSPDLAVSRRPAGATFAQARRADGGKLTQRARIHDLPDTAPGCMARILLRTTKRRSSAGQTWLRLYQRGAHNPLIGAALLKQNVAWQLMHRYIQVAPLAELRMPAPTAELMETSARGRMTDGRQIIWRLVGHGRS